MVMGVMCQVRGVLRNVVFVPEVDIIGFCLGDRMLYYCCCQTIYSHSGHGLVIHCTVLGTGLDTVFLEYSFLIVPIPGFQFPLRSNLDFVQRGVAPV